LAIGVHFASRAKAQPWPRPAAVPRGRPRLCWRGGGGSGVLRWALPRLGPRPSRDSPPAGEDEEAVAFMVERARHHPRPRGAGRRCNRLLPRRR